MPNDWSSLLPTASRSGAQKLGQPVPLSNFVVDQNRSRRRPEQVEVTASAREDTRSVLVEQRTGERRFCPVFAQHCILIRVKQLLLGRGGTVEEAGAYP